MFEPPDWLTDRLRGSSQGWRYFCRNCTPVWWELFGRGAWQNWEGFLGVFQPKGIDPTICQLMAQRNWSFCLFSCHTFKQRHSTRLLHLSFLAHLSCFGGWLSINSQFSSIFPEWLIQPSCPWRLSGERIVWGWTSMVMGCLGCRGGRGPGKAEDTLLLAPSGGVSAGEPGISPDTWELPRGKGDKTQSKVGCVCFPRSGGIRLPWVDYKPEC